MIVVSAVLSIILQSQPAIPVNREEWIREEDYPAGAVRDYEQGVVGVRLDVADTGRVSGCTVTASSGMNALDAQTCRVIRARARFLPAQNAAGQSVNGTFSQMVSWRIRRVHLLPVAAWSQVSRLTVEGDGRVSSCTTQNLGPVPAVKSDICKMVGKLPRRYFFGLRDGRGKKPVTVINQTTMNLDGVPAFPIEHEVPGRTLTSLISTRFTIDEAGKVQNCRVLDYRGSPQSPSICINHTANSFMPPHEDAGARRSRQATTLLASSLEADD